jgi:CRP-like cAMP-binding protein
MVQGEGDTCYRMTAAAFRSEMDRRGPFYVLLMRFAQAFVGFVMQSTACNAVHSVEQRLARWLLMARDRMDNDNFPLTQEFVAMMLGVTRPTVTVVAITLQRAGLIKYHRGRHHPRRPETRSGVLRMLSRRHEHAAQRDGRRSSLVLLLR